MLPMVTEATIDTMNALFNREDNQINYPKEISEQLAINQPHLRQAIIDSTYKIIEDLIARGLDADSAYCIGSSVLSLNFMAVHSLQAQAEVEDLENA